MATCGLHGKPAPLHLEQEWGRDLTITTGLVDASSTPTLMRLVASGQLNASRFISDQFSLDDIEKAYELFEHAADNGALKIVLTSEGGEDQ